MHKIIWWDLAEFSCEFCKDFRLDLKALFAEKYCKEGGLNYGTWQQAWMDVECRASEIIGRNWQGSEPSPFKQVAACALAIVEFAPIPEFIKAPEPENGETKSSRALLSTSRALAAHVGYSFAKAFLEGATIGRREEVRKIEASLAPTEHFKTDFLIALALTADEQHPFGKEPKTLSRVSQSFNFVTLVFESMAYTAELKKRELPGG